MTTQDAITRRLEVLRAQRQQAQEQMAHLQQQWQRLATEDVAAQGAIATLEAILAELEADEEG